MAERHFKILILISPPPSFINLDFPWISLNHFLVSSVYGHHLHAPSRLAAHVLFPGDRHVRIHHILEHVRKPESGKPARLHRLHPVLYVLLTHSQIEMFIATFFSRFRLPVSPRHQTRAHEGV